MENTISSQQISPQQRQEIYNIGKEFAFEGLDENYFKANNNDELEIFRQGFQEGIRIQTQNLENSQEHSTKGLR